MNILLAEDDKSLNSLLTSYLKKKDGRFVVQKMDLTP